MEKISKFFKQCGFVFSIARLKKAMILLVVFFVIGIFAKYITDYTSSDESLKNVYEKEISEKTDLGKNKVISVYKEDLNEDGVEDYIFLMGKEKVSKASSVNSNANMYEDVIFVRLNGQTNETLKYATHKEFDSEVTLKRYEDENTYYLISDNSGNINLLKYDFNKITDITKNTSAEGLLGYTIYTTKDEKSNKILRVKLDNYGKDYLKEYTKTQKLDFSESQIDLAKYRETYLRDKISKIELEDIDEDGSLEVITTQYILYNLNDNAKNNKTIGKVQISFNINKDKLIYNKVEINI